MSKYKVNDKFIVEIEEIYENGLPFSTTKTPCELYRIKGFNSLVFDENGLDKLQKYDSEIVKDNYYEAGRNAGQNDAWELAKKLFADMSDSELTKIFGEKWNYPMLMQFTPQECLAKLEAYEKEQEEIKAGDFCIDEDGLEWLVTYVNKGSKPSDIDYHCIDKKGYTSPVLYHRGELEKTGKHIEIQQILEQIGGVE